MAFTIPVAFDKFVENISVTEVQAETAERRRKDLVETLEGNFEILASFPTGSLARGTAVRGFADLDIMVVLHFSKHIKGKSPEEVLQTVRDVLSDYKTNVRKNGQAVTLYYKSWPNVDIVPVSRSVNEEGNVTHYNVPDANAGTWITSKPVRHSNAIAERAKTDGEGFLSVVQMAKWWNHQHSEYLQSFHIEAIALKTPISTTADFTWDMFQYFETAWTYLQGPLWYDGSQVDSYLSSSDRKEVLTRLETAKKKACSAWYLTYNQRNDHKAATELWQQIFGDKFPNYG